MKQFNKIKLLGIISLMIFSTATFTSCKKGCIDLNADNYYDKAKKDDGTCTYPTINVTTGGKSGDIKGAGGTASKSWTFTNSNTTVGYSMDITASNGNFNLTIQDASGTEVLYRALVPSYLDLYTVGVGSASDSGTSSVGTAGTWTATIILSRFNGSGGFSLN